MIHQFNQRFKPECSYQTLSHPSKYIHVSSIFLIISVVYSSNARRHPKFLSGEWTEEETLRNFLDSIDTPGCPDGKVTREEFMNYYSGVSSTVDDDCYFDLMMRACYGLKNKGQAK